MSMFEYGIGGNVLEVDASEAIADIPHNRTLLVEKLTSEDPIQPEKAEKLESIEDVFKHFKPKVSVDFEDEEGQEVNETLEFKTVADFLVDNMTKVSPHLNGLNSKQAFYNRMLKQLQTNKGLQRLLQNSETKEAFVDLLQNLLAEMNVEP